MVASVVEDSDRIEDGDMNTGHRANRLTTFDLMVTLALIALGLFVLQLVLPSPSIETRAILHRRSMQNIHRPRRTPPSQLEADAESFVQTIRHSPQTAEAIRNDPLLSTWSSVLSVEWLQQKLRQGLRVRVNGDNEIVDFAIRVDDPDRDTAILNATVNTFMRTRGAGKYHLLERATPPRLSTPQYRFRIVTAYLLCACPFSVSLPSWW
jgi:hypothetical protein